MRWATSPPACNSRRWHWPKRWCVVDQLFGERQRSMGYDCVPTAVFTHPNIGTVGLTEAAGARALGAVHVFRSEFKALRAHAQRQQERTLMKLVVDAASDRVVGLHMVGRRRRRDRPGLCRRAEGRRDQGACSTRTIGIHPTAAEEFVTMRDKAHTVYACGPPPMIRTTCDCGAVKIAIRGGAESSIYCDCSISVATERSGPTFRARRSKSTLAPGATQEHSGL